MLFFRQYGMAKIITVLPFWDSVVRFTKFSDATPISKPNNFFLCQYLIFIRQSFSGQLRWPYQYYSFELWCGFFLTDCWVIGGLEKGSLGTATLALWRKFSNTSSPPYLLVHIFHNPFLLHIAIFKETVSLFWRSLNLISSDCVQNIVFETLICCLWC